MMAVLAASFAVLLAILTVAELSEHGGVSAWARSNDTVARLRNLQRVLPHITASSLPAYLDAASRCHEGYAASARPWSEGIDTAETRAVAADVARALRLPPRDVRAVEATLDRPMFGYQKCPPGEIEFPVQGLVLSLKAPAGGWVHAEVHPHEWHVRQTLLAWLQRLAAVFGLVALVAVAFIYRLARPLRRLALAARRFGDGLAVEPVEESGPQDVRRTILAFNAMQRQVADEVKRRAQTLAALSHDLRTPLTALRVKAELVDDEIVRDDLIASIGKMEAVSASAIEFLRGESLSEPRRAVDVAALVESECADFEDLGASVRFSPSEPLVCECRPDALARAVRNLIDNAVKHGGEADVTVTCNGEVLEICIQDRGPGIPPHLLDQALEPFVRLSAARDSETGGFGLGLCVVKAVAEGHGGALRLSAREPSGLIATLVIPCTGRRRELPEGA